MPLSPSSLPPKDMPAAVAARPLVRLSHVNVTLQGIAALSNVNLTVHEGEHTALLGPNGAGKSTLLRVLRGEVRPDQVNGGSVLWFPCDTTRQNARPPEHPTQGPYQKTQGLLCPQGDDAPLAGRAMTALLSPALQEHFQRQAWNIRGEELVLAGLYDDYLLYREATDEQKKHCATLAHDLGVPELPQKSLNSLSQGQLRALLLLRAIIRRPRLLLLDEATDGLDSSTRQSFFGLLENLLAQPQPPTLVMTTHRSDLPAFLRIAISMDQGRLDHPIALPTQAAKDQTDHPRLFASKDTIKKLFAAPLLALSAFPQGTGTLPASSPCAPILGLSSDLPPAKAEAGLCLALRNATVFIDRVEVLHSLTWEMRAGQQWVIVGGNGAGKSTFLRTLMGEEIVAFGGTLFRRLPRHGGDNPPLPDVQRGIRIVSDRLQALYTYNENAEDVVFSGFDGSVGVYRDATPAEKAQVQHWLHAVGMARWAKRPFRALSTGQARRVLLARALVAKPEIILLDEPFSGLDTQSRADVTAILEKGIAAGLHTILVSHHAEDRLPSSTHVAHLENGVLVQAGPIASAAFLRAIE